MISHLRSDVWGDWLSRTRHDLFHTASYHEVEAQAEEATACIAVYGKADKFVAVPYLLKPLRADGAYADGSLREVASVYGYSGPVSCNCENDQDFLKQAWQSICDGWTDQGAVSAFIRFHPILGNAFYPDGLPAPLSESEQDQNVRLVGHTAAIDLTQPDETIWYGYSRHIRQAVRRCAEKGVAIEEDSEWRYLEDFVAIYHKTMERNHADDFYFFTTETLRRLKNAVGQHATCMVATYDHKIISAAILLEYDQIVNLYLLATDNNYLHLSPSKAVLHASQVWAKARGNRLFHLGGGRRGRSDEPLFRFKAAFTNQFFPFHVGRWILNQEAYDSLTEQRKMEATQCEGRHIDPSYFPAYRAPFR